MLSSDIAVTAIKHTSQYNQPSNDRDVKHCLILVPMFDHERQSTELYGWIALHLLNDNSILTFLVTIPGLKDVPFHRIKAQLKVEEFLPLLEGVISLFNDGF